MLPPEKFICDANGLKHNASAPSPWQQKYRLKLNVCGLGGRVARIWVEEWECPKGLV